MPFRRTILGSLLCCALAAQFPVSGHAAVTLSLEAPGTDLTALAIDQVFTIEAVLSGLQPTEELGYLAGTVVFDSSLLGSAFDVTPGDIIPDFSGFLGVGDAGLADGSYDFLFALSGTPITSNGVFFSFDVKVQTAGSGVIDFDSTTLAARDPTDVSIAIDSSGLAFSITGGTGVVPEPTSLAVFIGLISLMGLHRWRSRMRRQTVPVTTSVG